MSNIPTKTYPPEFLQRLIGDHETEQAGATPEDSSAVQAKGDAMSEIKRFDIPRHGHECMHEDPDGEYVQYDDHQAEVERLTAELTEAHERCGALELAIEQADEMKAHAEASAAAEEAETDRVTAERDAAQAEVERLIAERDESDWKLRIRRQESGDLFGKVLTLRGEQTKAHAEVERLTHERDAARVEVQQLLANYEGMRDTSRPTDEDIWREAFITLLPSFPWEKAAEKSDCVLVEYRKRWPR